MSAVVSGGRGIVTPQGVVLDLETAGIGYRGAARLIDTIVVVIAIIITSVLIDFSGQLVGETTAFVLQRVMGFLILFFYPIIAETYFRGRTVGKLAIGLRVVSLEAGAIGFREAFIRSLFQLVDFILTFGALALLTGMFTARSQRLGDIAAGTFVIVDPRVAPHLPAVPFTPPMGTEHIVANMDVRKLSPKQERVIRSYLLRVAELSAPARSSLGQQIADSTARHLGHEGRLGLDPERYLVAVLAARQLRDGGLAELAMDDTWRSTS